MKTISLVMPDDWHLHLRSGSVMRSIVGMSAAQMVRAVVMPNLTLPIKNTSQALAYRAEIMKALPAGSSFSPLMTIYLTDKTSIKDIETAAKEPNIIAAKLYPAGATTNSQSGVTSIDKIFPVLEAMQKLDMPLLVHGEVTDENIDIFDRETVFIDRVLKKVTRSFPSLKVVLEHITTKAAVDFILAANKNLAATITPQHLIANRNNMLVGGIKPHYYCLPVLKRQRPDQQALLKAATSGNPKFFLGTDSAPHERHEKEAACGCAGVFSAYAAIELYATVFESEGAIEKLEGFSSIFGPDFYGLPHNQETVTLERKAWKVPMQYEFGGSQVVPFLAGTKLSWKFVK
jgi:dihydroorotase